MLGGRSNGSSSSLTTDCAADDGRWAALRHRMHERLQWCIRLLCPVNASPALVALQREHQQQQLQLVVTGSSSHDAAAASSDDLAQLKEETQDDISNHQLTVAHDEVDGGGDLALTQHAPSSAATAAALSSRRLQAWVEAARARFRRRSDPSSFSLNNEAPEQQQLFLELFGKGLDTCGLPLHVSEFYLLLAAHRLGQHVTVVSLLTSIFMTFGDSSVCHLTIAERPGLSLSKMVGICHVAETIVTGHCSLEAGIAAVREVIAAPPLWSPRVSLVCMAVVAALFAPLFSGGPVEMVIAGCGGLLTGLLELWFASNRSIARGHDLLTGIFCSILAVIINEYVIGINVLAASLAGVVWSLPGLRICLGVMDISSGHAISGSAKLFTGILTAINIGIGITCGLQLQTLLTDEPIISQPAAVFPDWTTHIFVFLAVFPCMVLLDAPVSHAPVLTVGMVAAYEVSSALATRIGIGFGSFLAAALVGCLSNLYGRYTPHPSVELYLFSVLMIVPGSIGVRSVLASNTLTAIDFLFEMIEVAIAIVTGWYGGNILVPPLRAM